MRIKHCIILFFIILSCVVCLSGCNKINNNSEDVENITINNYEDKEQTVIVKTMKPYGFSGSSLHNINLYSNGDLYHVIYDGEGFEKSNIVKNEIIATNVSDIIQEDDNDGVFVVKGENINVIIDKYNWIKYEK